MECYERTKGEAVVTQPWSTGITLQVLPKTNVDEIPILAPGYGFSAMADGQDVSLGVQHRRPHIGTRRT